jgi:hypothetical protein
LNTPDILRPVPMITLGTDDHSALFFSIIAYAE